MSAEFLRLTASKYSADNYIIKDAAPSPRGPIPSAPSPPLTPDSFRLPVNPASGYLERVTEEHEFGTPSVGACGVVQVIG